MAAMIYIKPHPRPSSVSANAGGGNKNKIRSEEATRYLLSHTVLFYDPCCTLWRACVRGPRLRKRFPARAHDVALPAISPFLLSLDQKREDKKRREGKKKKERKKKQKEYGPLRTCIKITAIDRQVV